VVNNRTLFIVSGSETVKQASLFAYNKKMNLNGGELTVLFE